MSKLPISKEQEAEAVALGCQCKACQIKPHDSDCSVHNEPATPNGDCDCRPMNRLFIEHVNDRGTEKGYYFATLNDVKLFLSEQGLVALPAIPTEAMIDAGRSSEGLGIRALMCIYADMIAASFLPGPCDCDQ